MSLPLRPANPSGEPPAPLVGPDSFGAYLMRLCSALFVCGDCGMTTLGASIRPMERQAYNLYESLPSYRCDCGGLLEPIEAPRTANAKPNGATRRAGGKQK